MRKGFVNAPMFAAQNYIYIQTVREDMLQVKDQNRFAMLMRLRDGHTCDPGEVREEWGVLERTTGSRTQMNS